MRADTALRWFHPYVPECPVCGGSRPDARAPMLPLAHAEPRKALGRLCASCRGRIPWIVAVACPVCGRPDPCGDCLRRRERFIRCNRSAVRYDETMKEWLALYKYRGLERLEVVLAAMLSYPLEMLRAEIAAGPARDAPPRRDRAEAPAVMRANRPLAALAKGWAQGPAKLWHRIPSPGRKGAVRGAPTFDLLTSVPLSDRRLEERGFNQAERLALRLSQWYRIPYAPLLLRVRHTEKQSLQNRQGRLANMKGMFDVVRNAGSLLPGAGQAGAACRIWLVDDIYTTGSTLNECARVLREKLGPAFPLQIYGLTWARS